MQRYFDILVLRIVAGENCGQWTKLVDFLMTCSDLDYRKVAPMYPELMAAIKRYNDKHKGVVEAKLQRKQRGS